MSKIALGPTGILDPPWSYEKTSNSEKLRGYSTGHEYPSLDTEELAKLQIGNLMNYMFMWATGPFLEDAFKLVRAWGFEPVTLMYWVKCAQIETNGMQAFPNPTVIEDPKFKPTYGVGWWVRGCVEPIIIAKKPNVASIRTPWIGLLSPNAGHSRKPESLHQMIETNFPGPYIELFGRRPKENWTVLGNEAPGDGEDIRVSTTRLISNGWNANTAAA